MEKLDINELLRYGFSGALLFLASLISFKQTIPLIKILPSNLLGASSVLGIVLIMGSVIYAIHRSILYPLMYKVGCIVIYGKKQADIFNLDTKRWMRNKDQESLQHNFREWASQIHFLYCSTWATVLAQLIGHWNKWDQTNLHWLIWVVAITLGMAALIHHYRYLKYEHDLFSSV
ncbi:hypothetical protein TBH_C2719 [Thiolapillus brandeum]|uniref:Uncharacterized protein n=1 Tax=Thiolapillus brandeum TaxID=1076588 RepID=A0A7U6JIS9_9GAMM|nr:hypothetical protein TBH_C2719 [Thiolapillus brandeum]